MSRFHRENLKRIFSNPNYLIHEKELKKSVVLMPLFMVENELQILFEVRSPNIAQGLEVCFPGGRVEEKDLCLVDTGIRETMEELGIKEEKIEILGDLGKLINDSAQLIHGYIAHLDIQNLQELKPNSDEVLEVFSIPLQFFLQQQPKVYEISTHMESRLVDDHGNEIVLFPARELKLPERYHSKWRGKSRKIYYYEYENRKIWGITAAFLVDFCERLNQSNR